LATSSIVPMMRLPKSRRSWSRPLRPTQRIFTCLPPLCSSRISRRAPRTIDAYARGLAEFLHACERDGVDPVGAGRAQVAAFVRELSSRPGRRGANVVSLDSGAGLANATLQQRLVAVRLFYDFLISDAQPILASRNFVSPSRKVESPFTKGPLELIDSAEMLDQAQKWQDLYQRTIISPSR